MSEDSGPAPEPWVLDVGVLVAIARADADVTRLLLNLDAQGQPLIIPVLVMVVASADARTEDADIALRGLEQLDSVLVAPLRDAEQAARLAAITAKAGLEHGDAHVAAVATASACPILTLDAAKWQQHAADLDEPLETIEIAELPEG
ncbi:MAG: PIN domain-containing protein [Streptosporangiaceae bacterium]